MITDKISLSSNGEGQEEALKETEKFAQYMELSKKEGLKLRLLAEETLGMVAAITEDFLADFWLEHTEAGIFRIHLVAETNMNHTKKKELVSVSSKGRNEAAKGLMGKIREVIENSLYGVDDAGSLSMNYGVGSVMYGSMGMCDDVRSMNANSLVYMWSLERYRKSIDEEREKNPAVHEAWDELEKSIVASIADDVRVSVSGDRVELVIEKKQKNV